MAKNKKVKVSIYSDEYYPFYDFDTAPIGTNTKISKKKFKKWIKMKKIFLRWQHELIEQEEKEKRKEQKSNELYEKLLMAEIKKEYKSVPKEWKERMREINKKELEEIKKEKMAAKN